MIAYRKQRIDNAILFFVQNHYMKTKRFLSQTALYKYLAFFEFRCLKTHGDMPLELKYKAMKQGPVPIEIYDNRDNSGYFSAVIFEGVKTSSGGDGYIVKPKAGAEFNADYFSEVELEEMNNLIEIFSQRWVVSSVMSDASHREIKAWQKTYRKSPNAFIDPKDEFEKDIDSIPQEELNRMEKRYLAHRKIMELCRA
jgi:uncharacterized phage-associated protein